MSTEADLDALCCLPISLEDQLRTVIDNNIAYFILQGSDPAVEDGCCPSTDVGAANTLVKARVLDSWEFPPAMGGCQSTIYAFNGEIAAGVPKPTFTVNEEFREEVRELL